MRGHFLNFRKHLAFTEWGIRFLDRREQRQLRIARRGLARQLLRLAWLRFLPTRTFRVFFGPVSCGRVAALAEVSVVTVFLSASPRLGSVPWKASLGDPANKLV